MITARAMQTATLLPDGKVLIVGGDPKAMSGPALSSAEIYDPTTNSWSPAHKMSTGRLFQTATLLPDGKVLVLGGQAQGNNSSAPNGIPLASGEIFDPRTGSWSATAPMPRARSGHTATLLPNGLVLVAGGADVRADLFDPATGRWSSASSMPSPMVRATQTATLLADGRVLFAPGFDQDGMPFGPTPIYDWRTNSWSTTSPMTWGRTEAVGSALLPNGDVLVVGASAAGVRVDTAEVFTPSRSLWTAVLSDTQGPRYDFSLVLTIGSGQALAFRGDDPRATKGSAGQLYDWRTGSWTPSRPMSHPRVYGFTATSLANGRILIVGGMDPNPYSEPTDAAELFIP